jgi:hypothetical protein
VLTNANPLPPGRRDFHSKLEPPFRSRKLAGAGGNLFQAMKTQIPEQLKADVPQTTWGKILTATPVIMTVVATMLAGLASSEMTRAQYDRSLAAQQQSKAGDQWNFFQAKRLRASLQRSTLDTVEAVAAVHPLDLAALSGVDRVPGAKAALQTGELPPLPAAPAMETNLQAALTALEGERSESEIMPLLLKVRPETLETALRAARDRALAYDAVITPISRAIDQAEAALAGNGSVEQKRDFTAARLRYAAARYDAEARLNQAIASLYELQVRQGNYSAERHHKRSQRFFFGMLAAQAAVIISTFSLAARQRSMLWSLAAGAGLAAIAFAIYVYLYV